VKLRLATVAALSALGVALPVTPAAAAPPAKKGEVRMNEVQVIGTHNSYKREISEAEEAAYEAAINKPDDYDKFLA
jgi:hypothetical protein